MKKFYKRIIQLLLFLFVNLATIFFANDAKAQISVSISVSRTSNTTSCTDCNSVVGCGGDPYWEADSDLQNGDYEGDGDNDGGSSGGTTSVTLTDAQWHCTTGSTPQIRVCVRACEDDDFGVCGGALDDCVSGWACSAWQNVDGSNNSGSGLTSNSSGSAVTVNWSTSETGGWRPNQNSTGVQTNSSCSTAFALTSNGSGLLADDHMNQCSEPTWYRYTLTDNNRDWIEFDPSGVGFDQYGEIDEVRYGSCTGCILADDGGGVGVWQVNDPKPGDYYILVDWYTVTGLWSRPKKMDLEVFKGSTLSVPGNDDICNATSLSAAYNYNSSSVSNSGNTDNATSQDFCSVNEPDNNLNKSIWWKFTTGANPPTVVTLDPDASGVCTGWAAAYSGSITCPFPNYTSNHFSGLTKIGESSVGGSFDLNCLAANTTYYIQGQVTGLCSSGSITINMSNNGAARAPDNICSAVSIGTNIGQNQTATTPITYGNHCSTINTGGYTDPANADANQATDWFTFTTPATVPVGYTFEFVNYDFGALGGLELEVYRQTGGTCPPTLSYVGNHDPALCGVGGESNIFCLQPSSTYYLMVDEEFDGACSGRGEYQLRVKGLNSAATADECVGALNIAGGTLNSGATLGNMNTTSYSNLCATASATSNPWSLGTVDNDVWLKFTTGAYPGTIITVDATNDPLSLGDGMDVQLAIYEGCPTSGGVLVDKDYDPGFLSETMEVECLKPSTTYYVRVDGDCYGILLCNGEQGHFGIEVRDNGLPLLGDNICSAIDLGTLNNGATITSANLSGIGLGTKSKFSTECSSKQTNEPFISNEAGGQEGTVWMKFTTAATGVGVKTRFDATAEDEALTEFSELRVYSMSGACNNANLSNLTMLPNVEDEVGYDALPIAGCIPEIDYSNMTAGCLLPNTTYYVQVHIEETPDAGLTDEQANFTFSIVNSKDKSIGNDLVCNAVALPTIPNSTFPSNSTYGSTVTLLEQNNYCAGSAGDYPSTNYSDLNQTVWYSFLAPASGSAQFHIYNDATPYTDAIRLQATIYDPVGGVVGDNLATNCTKPLAELNSYDCGIGVTSCDIEWTDQFYADCMTPGKMYFLRVDGYYAGVSYCNEDYFRGKFHIDVRDYDAWPASNDKICNAVALGALNTTATACHPTAGISAPNNNYAKASCVLGRTPDNYCATATGEPTPSAWSPVANVWFSFVAPPSGRVMIATQNDPQSLNENIMTKLAVYDSVGPGLCPTNDISKLVELGSDYDTWDGTVGLDNNSFCNRGIYGTFWCTSCVLPCEDVCNRDELLERVICLRPGELYYVTVDGINFNRPLDGCGDGVPEIEGKFDLYVIDIGGIPSSVVNTAQKNDNCVSAYNMGTAAAGVGGTIAANNFNNECATVEVGEPDPIGWDYNGGINIGNDGPDNTLWFKFVAPATGHVTVYIETDSKTNTMDAQVAVYSMPGGASTCVVNQLEEVRAEYDWVPPTSIGTKDEELEIKCLIPGQTYFIQVDGEATALGCTDDEPITEDDYLDGDLCKTGYFDVTVTTNSTFLAPVNDNACAAKNLGVIDGGASPSKLVGETNWCATEETTEPNTSQLTNKYSLDYDETVWYYFTTGANPAGTRIEVTNSQIFNVLGVFGGTHTITIYETKNNAAVSCGNFTNLNEIASSGGIIGSANEDLEVECLKPNWRYYVQIDGLDLPNFEFGGKHTQYGSFDIQAIDGVSGGGIIPNEDYVCSAYNLGTVAALGTAQLLNQDNYCAGIEPGEPYVNGDPNDVNSLNYDETMWYKFTTANTPSNTRNIRIRVDGDNLVETDAIDISWVLYGGTPSCSGVSPYQIAQFGGLYEVEQSDFISTFDEQQDVECLDPNTTYYLQVDGLDVLNLDHGNYSIYITDLGSGPSAGNDDICGTINLGTFTGGAQTLPASTTTYTNACATEQGGEPNVSGNPVPSDDGHDETVWFRFTTSATPGNISISINGATPTYSGKWQGFNVYRSISGAGMSTNCNTSPDWNNLDYVGQSSVFNTTTPSLLLTCLPPNTIYYIQVDAWDDAVSGNIDGGTFTLSVSDNGVPITSPSNDNLANAYNFGTIPNLGSASVTAYANTNNYCATSENGEPNCDYNAPFNSGSYDETVWYKFTTSTSPNDILLDFTNTTTLAAEVNLSINLYESPIASPVFGNLTHVASLTQNLISGYDLRYNCAKPNQIYFIQVDGQDLTNNQTPDNVSGTNTSKGEWDLTVSSVGTSGLVHDNLTQTYNVGTVGNACGASISLAAGVETNNTCATTEASEPNVDAGSQPTNGADETVWYHFIAPSSGRVTITVNGDVTGTADDMDPSFNVYHSTLGTSLATAMSQLEYISGDRTYVAGVDVGPGVPFDKLAEVRDLYCLIPGHYYHLQVDGWDGPLADQFGQFSITISNACSTFSPPANDECSGATTMTVNTTGTTCTEAGFGRAGNVTTTYNNNATISSNTWNNTCLSGDSYCAGDVWYQFTAPQTGTMILEGENTADVDLDLPELGMIVYSGTCPSGLSPIRCTKSGENIGTTDITTTFPVTAGQTYFIKVFDADGSEDPGDGYQMCLTQTCSMDACANALPLQDDVAVCWDLSGSTGEPVSSGYQDCNSGEPAEHSIWYTFNAPDNPIDAAAGVTITLTGIMNVDISPGGTGCSQFGLWSCDRDGVSVAIMKDPTPCDGSYETLVDCFTTDLCEGALWGWSKTYTNLTPNASYVIMINSQDNGTGGCWLSNAIVDHDPIDFGTLTISTVNNVPLPVELISFTGYHDVLAKTNNLNWITASEVNTAKFVVERSSDARNYSGIGEKAALGTSTVETSYDFTDYLPLEGDNYYRLRIVDNDGSISYSKAILIQVPIAPIAKAGILSIYPNPTTGKLTVQFQSSEKADYTFSIVNVIGQVMRSEIKTVSEGVNSFELDVEDFAQGVYIMNFKDHRGESFEGKFVKQ
ncbi:MAG: T9SS type A sorting domain-containing protein [Chitinophagales bacterium]|nr:T9SS type A sorting domain-containing protein [Chitinophagales bacterium]